MNIAVVMVFMGFLSNVEGSDPVPLEMPAGGTLWMNCTDLITDLTTLHSIRYYKSGSMMFRQAVIFNVSLVIEDPAYTGRVTALRWGSAGILNVSKQDEGDYSCEINFFISSGKDPAVRRFISSVINSPSKPTAIASKNPVNEGDDVTLACTTTPAVDSTPSYNWMKSGSPVQHGGRISMNPTTGTLTITGIQRVDGGEYQCSVTNIAGTGTSDTLHLQVYCSPEGGPVISGYNNYTSVDAGVSVTLTCNSNGGNPRATLTWSCSWTGFTDPGPGLGRLDLLLNMVKAYHQQTCTCTARHPVVSPDQVASRTFNVLYAAGDPALELSAALPWIENQQYTATCRSAMGNPPNEYEWYINNVQQAGQDSSQFTTSFTKDHNQGILRCNVKNSYSDRHSQTLKAEKVLNVEFSPRVSVGDNLRPIEGDTTVLECSASSNPVAQADNYRWIHLGGSRTHTGPTWSLSPLDKTYTATYECQVTVESAGQHGQLTGSSSLRVTVQYLKLSLEQQNLTKMELNRLQISCSGEGEPPNIQFNMWKHERHGVIRYIPGQVSGTHNRLVMDPVEYTDDGVYTCQGGNGVSQKEIKSYVIIHYAPKNTDPTPGKQVFTNLGEDVSLLLNVTAVPSSVDFAWRRVAENGSLIQLLNNSKTMIIHFPLSSRLTIYKVTAEEFANYSVHASNGILNGSNFIYSVASRSGPGAPFIDGGNSFSTPVSVLLSWTANSDGGYIQTFSVHYRETPGGNYILHRGNIPDPGYGKTSADRIVSLKSSTSYQFLVTAHNDHNAGTNVSSNEVTIQTRGLPLLDMSSLKVERLGHVAYLSWSRPSGNYDEQRIEQWENGSNRKKRETSGCMPPSCTTHNPDAHTDNYTITGLDPQKDYRFVLVLLYRNETVSRQEFKQESHPERRSGSSGSLAGAFVGGFSSASVIFGLIILILNRRGCVKGDPSVCKDKIRKKTKTSGRPYRGKTTKTEFTECSSPPDMVDQQYEVIQGQGKDNKQSCEQGYESLATPGLYEDTRQKGQSSEAVNTYEELKMI